MTSESLRWFTSSYSDNGGTCVEVASWVTSTYSNNGGDCVEVAVVGDSSGHVPVRDSKDPSGPALTFTPAAWTAFLTGIRQGDFPLA